MAGAAVAAAAVDLFHDHRGLGHRQAGTTVLLGNQRRHPAGLGQRVDEFLGVAAHFVDLAEVLVGKLRTQVAHGVADVGELVVVIVRKGDSMAGLVVDELIGQQEIVIKSLGKYINCTSRMISGATILGDGEVALILDANALI